MAKTKAQLEADNAAMRKQLAAAGHTPEETDADAVPEPTAAQKKIAPGDVVTRTAFDPYSGAGGQDTTTYGLVVALADTDEAGTAGAVVYWLNGNSHPVALSDLDPTNE
jgi:hypothetical protein